MSPKRAARGDQLWTCLRTQTDEPNEHGEIGMHFTLRHETGVTFVVSITGNGFEKGKHFIDALRASAALLSLTIGGKEPGARLLKPSEVN